MQEKSWDIVYKLKKQNYLKDIHDVTKKRKSSAPIANSLTLEPTVQSILKRVHWWWVLYIRRRSIPSWEDTVGQEEFFAGKFEFFLWQHQAVASQASVEIQGEQVGQLNTKELMRSSVRDNKVTSQSSERECGEIQYFQPLIVNGLTMAQGALVALR